MFGLGKIGIHINSFIFFFGPSDLPKNYWKITREEKQTFSCCCPSGALCAHHPPPNQTAGSLLMMKWTFSSTSSPSSLSGTHLCSNGTREPSHHNIYLVPE
ncbi:Protein CBG25316 [Caenorhabditis briggsae]|uniref:Protein CBG25316 n=1 Tax=Caenorhabditis briggsae TaxID=6238 RepID=B6IH14_CAEBR|nr:Protein CBG25316 [Caenorhabditis briggsae]CAR99194.1 Protein CBG25316 [Caenorhabditis briggsae]